MTWTILVVVNCGLHGNGRIDLSVSIRISNRNDQIPEASAVHSSV